MTKDKARLRASALVALATDKESSESESRTAAMAAVRLIAEHDLLAHDADDEREPIGNDDIRLRRAAEAGATLIDAFLKRTGRSKRGRT